MDTRAFIYLFSPTAPFNAHIAARNTDYMVALISSIDALLYFLAIYYFIASSFGTEPIVWSILWYSMQHLLEI